MSNYFGGYYLLRLKKFDYGKLKGKEVCTCSDCTNISLINSWSFSWATTGQQELADIERDFEINSHTIQQIRIWADQKLEQKKIGWINVFSDLETVNEYKNKFFSHLSDTKIFSLYFPDSEAKDIIEKFKPTENDRTLGIWDNLAKRISETDDEEEITLGYDLIGIEGSGDFHSFNCHDIADELVEKFDATINKYGLIDDPMDWTKLTDFMNDEANGHEPTPWYVCKVKMRLRNQVLLTLAKNQSGP